jgi:hypothetical protein
MNNEITERVRVLANVRELHESNKSKLKARQDAFNVENANLINEITLSAPAIVAAEVALKAVVESEYRATGEKKPAAGVEVKLFKEFAIDEAAGLAWAKEKELCLIPEQLDVAAVKKLATVQPLPFVTVTQIPKVTIASDLTKALAAIATANEVISPATPAEV